MPTGAGKATTTWLIDRSAYVRLGQAADPNMWAERIDRGLIRISTVTRLELGSFGPDRFRPPLRDRSVPVGRHARRSSPRAIEDRAVEVQLPLADRGQHRAPSIPDLGVAATAELAGLTVFHFDRDFELIADVTGQPTERLST